MKIGDLVRNYMTEQLGTVVAESCHVTGGSDTDEPHSFQVLWTTTGDFGGEVGSKEWTGPTFVEILDDDRS